MNKYQIKYSSDSLMSIIIILLWDSSNSKILINDPSTFNLM